MQHPYILLWLEGPLQSWGHDSHFGRRDTLSFPTKSGILGMVCAALGARGEQKELLASMADLDLQVISLHRAGKNSTGSPPLLRDFHMVGSGYDESDPWQSLLVPKTSQGKKPVGGGTKVTYRYFLQDAVFAVFLQVPAALADTIQKALQNPVWTLYLGRKCCVPTEFIFQGLFDDIIAAEATVRRLCSPEHKNLLEHFRVVQGGSEKSDVQLVLNDVPIQFGLHKVYRDRQVGVVYGVGF